MAAAASRRLSRAQLDIPPDPYRKDKAWLDRQYFPNGKIMTPVDIERDMKDPPVRVDRNVLDKIHGSLVGMALGDALGASVEFRPHAYLEENPIDTLTEGGTWGLKKGQFTDDTSMGLCLGSSLVVRRTYIPYDQLVRYKWWYKEGYMSSTGACFDIGKATRQSLINFEKRQREFSEKHGIRLEDMDYLTDPDHLDNFDANCSDDGAAGNGSLMRLAAVPLFFYRDPLYAIKCAGHSGEITHGDEKAYDACRYYGALIVAALRGESREDLIDPEFYEKHKPWFDGKPLHPDILEVAHGSYQKKEGYAEGIRGKGYVVQSLEAALWALWSDGGKFIIGVLKAVNLGDDTDTTAAIYGQLAGTLYGFKSLPPKWIEQVYAKNFIKCLSTWIVYEGEQWWQRRAARLNIPVQSPEPASEKKGNTSRFTVSTTSLRRGSVTLEQCQSPDVQINSSTDTLDEPKSNFKPRRSSISNSENLAQRTSYRQDSTSNLTTVDEQEPQSPQSDQRIYVHKTVKSSEDVCHWIESLGKDYKPYKKIFKDAAIDGYWLLNQLDEKQLIDKGITHTGHRQVILHRIDDLRKECPKRYAAAAAPKK